MRNNNIFFTNESTKEARNNFLKAYNRLKLNKDVIIIDILGAIYVNQDTFLKHYMVSDADRHAITHIPDSEKRRFMVIWAYENNIINTKQYRYLTNKLAVETL